MDHIRLLPDSLANQIAAGEVVQRPSSVIKEMLENSIDAGARNIHLILKDAGKSLIQVIDDGSGMSENDARMCFERHATSKISRSDDLFNIRTLGFRGEAMASIAAVSQVEMRTKRAEDETGTLIYIEGADVKKQEPVAAPDGTSISVKNLFFNVPARRKFLKSNSIELRHLTEEFQRISLAKPEISFVMEHNGQEIYRLRSGKLAKRIVSIFGKNYQQRLIACREELEHIKLYGYIGKPDHAKKTRGEQFFFLNNRFIRHGYLHHAVMQAFKNLLPDKHFPLYVLFLEMEPGMFDVNVHPTKAEVKFEDERVLYALIHSTVKKALGVHTVTPSIDFDLDVNFVNNISEQKSEPSGNSGKSAESYYGSRDTAAGQRQKQNLRNWERLYDGASPSEERREIPEEFRYEFPETEEAAPQKTLTFESAANSIETASETPKPPKRYQKTFQFEYNYIVTRTRSGIIIIDQHLAHERILYERYLERLSTGKAVTQHLLFPHEQELNPADFLIFEELSDELSALGFVFELKDRHRVSVLGVPSEMDNIPLEGLLENLMEQFKNSNSPSLSLEKQEILARTFGKRSAIRRGITLEPEEMNRLIDELFACENPNYTATGKKVFIIIDTEQILDLFE